MVTYEARLLPCSAVLNTRMGLKRAKRSGIQAQTTLIPVPVTTLEVQLKSTVSTDCLWEYRSSYNSTMKLKTSRNNVSQMYPKKIICLKHISYNYALHFLD